jgi:hypothetical protein
MTAADAKKYGEIKNHWTGWVDAHREKIASNGFVHCASATLSDHITFLVAQVDRLEAELGRAKEDLQLRLDRDDKVKK